MNPNASTLWRGKRWQLALLLACLGMLGPFSIDTYLPAFAGIARSLDATPVQMQQTLSSYLLGFGVMNLFHGALSDSLGRRPVVLAGVAAFTLASLGCALSQTIGELVFWRAVQGMSAGAGMVVSRAIIRDMFPPADAQRVMSQVTIYFGIAPAVAPLVGGYLFVHADWHAIFWLLVAAGGRCGWPTGAGCPRVCTRRHASPSMPATCCAVMRSCCATRASWRWSCQRHALQRHVPVRAVGTGVAGRAPAAGATAVLLVLRAQHQRHHGRRLVLGPHGRQGRTKPADPPGFRDHAGHVGW
jgi:multidrug resistance protein